MSSDEEASGSSSDDEEEKSDEEAAAAAVDNSSSEDDEEDDDEDAEQDELDADLEAPIGGDDDEEDSEDDEEEEEDDDVGEEDEGVGMKKNPAEPTAGFLEGGKSDTFARAFNRILDSSVAKPDLLGAPILAGSKSIAARKAEDEAEAKADRAAKKLRLEMRQRGHVVPKHRGVDPVADVREKSFQKTATRGVVRLFNAVAKAQKRLRDEEGASGSRAKAAKLGKASFLAELRNSRAETTAGGGGGESEAVVPSARPTSAAAAAMAAGREDDSDGDEDGGAGWAVLQEGFTGLQGASKMKDWDKQMEDESDGGGGGDDDDDDDNDGSSGED